MPKKQLGTGSPNALGFLLLHATQNSDTFYWNMVSPVLEVLCVLNEDFSFHSH